MNTYDVAIIGAGASGLMAAAACSWAGKRVVLLEAHDRIGKPILVTGNGRCNVGNTQVDPAVYNKPDFVAQAFAQVSPNQALDFLRFLGLEMVEESAGRLYPASNKAASVLDVLRFALADKGAEVRTATPISNVEVQGAGADSRERSEFLLYSDDTLVACARKLVIATGPADISALLPVQLQSFAFKPRLVSLKTKTTYLKGMENVRIKALVSLLASESDPTVLYQEQGEVQFRDYGVSGVCIFNLSRRVTPGSIVSLNLVPRYTADELKQELSRRARLFPRRSSQDKLAGLVLPVVATNVLARANVSASGSWSASEIERIAHALQHFDLSVQGFGPTKQAQVHRGGISASELNPSTLELTQIPGCYALGEAIDIDADCGGFNLVWAWVSALACAQDLCATSASEIMEEQL